MRSPHLALALALVVFSWAGPVRADEPCTAPDGTICPDDGDPCTTDQCSGGLCVHANVANRVTCDPVLDAYRRTLGLGALVADSKVLLDASVLAEGQRVAVRNVLDIVGTDLAATSDALAGRIQLPPPMSGETIAQLRARAAYGLIAGTPLIVRPTIGALASLAPDLARRARFLYRSTNQLKRELRRLQRVSGVFAR